MVKETIGKIEDRIRQAECLGDDQRKELMVLVGRLSTEIDSLADDDGEQAERITGFAELSTREATRNQTNMNLLDVAMDGMKKSVEGFEASHPTLVENVNGICMMLSNIGI